MNEALQRWREDFAREPDTAFDRLVRGVVPLGGASQLSFGEIIDALFEPGDVSLDAAAAGWLEQRILGPVPENTSLHRWVSILEEYFRGIAAMELPLTGEILRRQHKRLRLWLHGLYEGPDRDPEGAYLVGLARAQDDQRFSPLWRRLILGEELAGRPYIGIGILGFRKMPGQDRPESSGVPEGLLQALVELADRSKIGQAKWKQTMRSLFATYRRNENYWIEHLTPLLSLCQEQSNARAWITALLPRIRELRAHQTGINQAPVRRAPMVPVHASKEWVRRVRNDPTLCDTAEFAAFLDQQRAYAESSGDAGQLNLAFNNLATNLIKADRGRVELAISLMEEALEWAPWDPHNWTSYAIVLCTARRENDAINALWKARHHFPWNPIIRSELARILRKSGDFKACEGVLREAVAHFPSDVVCQAELADLLIDLDEVQQAEKLFRKVLELDPTDRAARGGLARALSIRGARTQDDGLRNQAEEVLQELAVEGDSDAQRRLQNFDDQWERALRDPNSKFRWGAGDSQARRAQQGRAIMEMSVAERLGRAMITLWRAERVEDVTQRSSLCAHATALLEVPAEQIDDDLLAAFVETRGLVLLASGDSQRALAYFEDQIHHYGRGGWIGIQLGDQRARIALGMPKAADDTVEASSSQSARFALYVARVIQTLSASPLESEVRELLKTLYPRASDFAARTQPDAKGGLSVESGAEMLGAFLQTRWFRPAGIQSPEDFDRPDALHAVVERINNTRTDTFDVISNAASDLPMAA